MRWEIYETIWESLSDAFMLGAVRLFIEQALLVRATCCNRGQDGAG